jgi:hypothetical protein
MYSQLVRAARKNTHKMRLGILVLMQIRSLGIVKAVDNYCNRLRELISRPLPSSDWDKQYLPWTIDQFEDDVRTILKYGGKPHHFRRISEEVAE